MSLPEVTLVGLMLFVSFVLSLVIVDQLKKSNFIISGIMLLITVLILAAIYSFGIYTYQIDAVFF